MKKCDLRDNNGKENYRNMNKGEQFVTELDLIKGCTFDLKFIPSLLNINK